VDGRVITCLEDDLKKDWKISSCSGNFGETCVVRNPNLSQLGSLLESPSAGLVLFFILLLSITTFTFRKKVWEKEGEVLSSSSQARIFLILIRGIKFWREMSNSIFNK